MEENKYTPESVFEPSKTGKKNLKKKKKLKSKMKKRHSVANKQILRNFAMIASAILLIAYALTISLIPYIYTITFDNSDFERKIQESTSFIADTGKLTYKIKPNLHAIITMDNINLKWVGDQELFSAKTLEMETNNPFCVFTKHFDIKTMTLKNGHYYDQILPEGKNKLYSFVEGSTAAPFGVKKLIIKPGNLKVKNYKVHYTSPETYNEESIKEHIFSKTELKEFLKGQNFSFAEIK